MAVRNKARYDITFVVSINKRSLMEVVSIRSWGWSFRNIRPSP